MKNKHLVAITGGIGSGKSLALSALKEKSYLVLSSDKIVSELYEKRKIKLLLKTLLVGHRAADRGDKGHQNSGNRAGITPVGQIIGLTDAGALSQGVEINGKQCGNQQDKGGVTDIV
jgi:hypothetical protein